MGGARFPADIYTPYIHIYMYIYISQILTDAKFNVESHGAWDELFGLPRPCSYIYLRKTSKVNVPVP